MDGLEDIIMVPDQRFELQLLANNFLKEIMREGASSCKTIGLGVSYLLSYGQFSCLFFPVDVELPVRKRK